MEKAQPTSKKWKILVPTAAVIASLILFGFSYSKLHWKETWSSEDVYAGAVPAIDIDLGHGPVSHPSQEPNEFSKPLHHKDHVGRDPRQTKMEWNITKALRRPDGVLKPVYLINEEFGPTLEVRSGDELFVTVRNQLEEGEGVAIHWHGLRIANEMDGVVGLTQSEVLPGETFTYILKIPSDQFGTFWYHSHSDIQRADGLFGALVIHKPSSEGDMSEDDQFGYEEEQVLVIGDWYHRSAAEVLSSYTDWKNFKIEPAPDSMLLNGKGYFECSQATKANPVDCIETQLPHLTLPGRTRLRIINAGALTGFSLTMTGYTMTLVQVDGGNPVEAIRSETVGILYPGERMDLILERTESSEYESAWITVTLDRENMQFPNLALTERQQFPITPSLESRSSVPAEILPSGVADTSWINLAALNGSGSNSNAVVTETAETVLLYATISYLTEYEYRPKGFINHTSWNPSDHSSSPLLTIERKDWPDGPKPLVVKVQHDHWVHVVLNNLDDKGHPFHLHGHDFQVLATHTPSRTGAFEQYNPFDESSLASAVDLNFDNPVTKDTVYVPSMGYAILRFRADNPGLWLFHCHVLWHEAVGMNVAIDTRD